MADTNNLFSVSYSNGDGDSDNSWVRMQQEEIAANLMNVTNDDVAAMVNRARAGISATTYSPGGCPVFIADDDSGDAVVVLGFYMFTSSDTLPVTLVANIGVVSEVGPQPVDIKELKVFEFSNSTDIGYRVDDETIVWKSDVYSKDVIKLNNEKVLPVVVGSKLKVSEEIFGVVEISGKALARYCTLAFTITKTSGYKIQNIKPIVIASWDSGGGSLASETLTLTVPDCVYPALTTCDDGELKSSGSGIFKLNPDKSKKVVAVYYSDCNGDFLGREYV